jgi:hypothetical protein
MAKYMTQEGFALTGLNGFACTYYAGLHPALKHCGPSGLNTVPIN